MFLTKKLTDFLLENESKPKSEVIKLMMKEFNYKESTAISRYSDYNCSNKSSLKKVAFDFFDNNPSVLNELDNKSHSKELGIPITTYAVYKSQYKSEKQKTKQRLMEPKREKDKPKYGEKYYKGRTRQKFTFNDSKLF